MFPEYRDLITQLKTSDHHASAVCLINTIPWTRRSKEQSRTSKRNPREIENLKKEKLPTQRSDVCHPEKGRHSGLKPMKF